MGTFPTAKCGPKYHFNKLLGLRHVSVRTHVAAHVVASKKEVDNDTLWCSLTKS